MPEIAKLVRFDFVFPGLGVIDVGIAILKNATECLKPSTELFCGIASSIPSQAGSRESDGLTQFARQLRLGK